VASACANATSKLACSCIDPFLIIIMEKRMTDYVLLVAAVGICMLWGAWRDRVNDNKRDSALMAGLGISTLLGSAGILVVAN
jgi:hypothetical protein